MIDEEWDTLSSTANISRPQPQESCILTPESSPELKPVEVGTFGTEFIIPKINLEAKRKRFNLFDKYSYTQLVEHVVRTKITHRDNLQFQRGGLYRWFKDLIDTDDEKCSQFLLDNEKSLFRMRNKRQLLMLLNRKFSKVHPSDDGMKLFSTGGAVGIIPIMMILLVVSVITILLFYIIVFHTTFVELLFRHDEQKLAFVKTIRSLAISLVS